jgi:hypothetical protein
MDTYLAGQALTPTVELVDSAGVAITATAISRRVLDQDGTVILEAAALTPPVSGTTLTVPVGAIYNALAEGQTRALRVIELTITTAQGVKLVTSNYIIEALEPLSVPTTSFQTFAQAQLASGNIAELAGWRTATRSTQIAALIEARNHIARLQFTYIHGQGMNYVEPEFAIGDISLLDEEEFEALSEEFRAALALAQIYEADDILGGNPFDKRRRDGVMSETIGESSMMFRPGTPTERTVCSRALKALSRYINRSVRIGRA